MTDRELLELAAKAAGITLEWDGNPEEWMPMYYEGKTYHSWNPLDDDGDAFRLAVKLGLLIDCDDVLKDVEAVLVMRNHNDQFIRMNEPYGDDPYAATRRAIVRAAAEIGREMID